LPPTPDACNGSWLRCIAKEDDFLSTVGKRWCRQRDGVVVDHVPVTGKQHNIAGDIVNPVVIGIEMWRNASWCRRSSPAL